MKIDFEELDMEKAVTLVRKAADESDELGAAENTLFYEGNHWQEGKQWTGPQPRDTASPAALDLVKKEFASKNAIRESVTGHRDAVISREPEWTFTVRRPLAKKGDVVNGIELTEDEKLNTDEAALIREANSALTRWWNERDILNVLQIATARLLTNGRATLRVYIPPAELTANRQMPRASSLDEALDRIYLLSHSYKEAGIFTDTRSMNRVGIFATEEDGRQTVEVTYLKPDGRTLIRTREKDTDQASVPFTPNSSIQSIFASKSQEAGEETSLPLGGHLAMHEMKGEIFVSPQMREGNKSLNKAKTLRGHVINEAGFPETSLLNVNLPGKLESDPKRPGGQRFVPDPIERGSSIVNSWVGIEYEDGQGNKHIATPSIHYRDIPSLQSFIECERADYQDVLEESGQSHKLIAGDATASALSRIQAKAAFGTSLLTTVSRVNTAVRWMGETVLTMAAVFMGQSERFAELRMNADCRVDTGPILPDEVRVGMELVEKKVWSRARLQRMTGVEDTESEDAVILADERKLNPVSQVQLERAKIGLEADRRSADQGITQRIEEAASEVIQ